MAHVPSAVNDKFTVDDIAMKVSRALDLPTTNRELGRSIIREALQAADMEGFKELVSNYGTFDLEFTEQLYEGIRSVDARLKRAAAAKAKAAQAEGPEDPSAPSVLPFSRSFGTKKEQLAGYSCARKAAPRWLAFLDVLNSVESNGRGDLRD